MKPPSFKPRQSLGQHFLIDQNVADKVVRSLKLRSTDYVLEIGPGQGSLTHLIVPNVAKLIAVELDQRLASIVQCQFGDNDNLKLINADFLSLELESLTCADSGLRIVGNIPYNIYLWRLS